MSSKGYNNTDLNDDGEPDFGLCYFPEHSEEMMGWWWAELMYSIWASYGQVEELKTARHHMHVALQDSQGFLFDPETLEPRLGVAFRTATEKMKEMLEATFPVFVKLQT